MFNPYALGGWTAAANLNADSARNTVPQPSIFGALPYPTQDPPSMFISFRFTSFSPSILDCTVVGPQAKTHFHISTDIPTPGFTTIFNADNEPMTIIEWLPNPVLEIRGIVPKQRVSEWLVLSPAKRYRTMVAQGRTFIWAPDGESICLYALGLGVPQTHARLTREDGAVALEITAEAIRIGLLPVCVTAAFLLQSGRNID
ncbi:hypothetical protein DFH08DRAFT_793059 [Mycena albidolilacea]|uniref:DUF6593 domain-containing protein n=1 Tax=Mycena albidolilacea TaxID=1033008 RepID=A0AAD6Z588_9AGAR|nr:hypothetical protein DFH08DRAFT_793059 [Mycena albidolilacea]